MKKKTFFITFESITKLLDLAPYSAKVLRNGQ